MITITIITIMIITIMTTTTIPGTTTTTGSEPLATPTLTGYN
jgi:hypothetical protein